MILFQEQMRDFSAKVKGLQNDMKGDLIQKVAGKVPRTSIRLLKKSINTNNVILSAAKNLAFPDT